MSATAGVRNGSGITIYVDDTDGSEVLIDHCTDLSVSAGVDLRDITTKDNAGYRAVVPGLKNISVNFTAFYAADATNGYDEMLAFYLAGTKQYVKVQSVDWSNGAATPHAGDQALEFEAYISSIELSAGTEDNASYTCTLECTGGVTYTTISA